MYSHPYEDPEELRQVQRASTLLVGEFHRVCQELGLSYVAHGGTAIGAIRHHGFIPWDDDVDLAMPRADYERFLKEAPSVLGPEFAIHNTRVEKDFPCVFSTLILKGTSFVPEFFSKCPYDRPLSIDIFPLDNFSDDPKKRASQKRRTWIWGRLMFLRATATPYLEVDGVKRGLILAACAVAHGILLLFHVTPQKIQRHYDAAARMCEGEKTKTMTDFSDRFPEKWAVTYDELFPARPAQFENITILVPNNYDAVLTRGYGDYMSLPPVDQRKNHHPSKLDLAGYGKE